MTKLGLALARKLVVLSGERVSNTWITCPIHWDTFGKLKLIPDKPTLSHGRGGKDLSV